MTGTNLVIYSNYRNRNYNGNIFSLICKTNKSVGISNFIVSKMHNKHKNKQQSFWLIKKMKYFNLINQQKIFLLLQCSTNFKVDHVIVTIHFNCVFHCCWYNYDVRLQIWYGIIKYKPSSHKLDVHLALRERWSACTHCAEEKGFPATKTFSSSRWI